VGEKRLEVETVNNRKEIYRPRFDMHWTWGKGGGGFLFSKGIPRTFSRSCASTCTTFNLLLYNDRQGSSMRVARRKCGDHAFTFCALGNCVGNC
jgi:hypothetical protein